MQWEVRRGRGETGMEMESVLDNEGRGRRGEGGVVAEEGME